MKKLYSVLPIEKFICLFKKQYDFRIYINVALLILWVLIFNRYLFTDLYHNDFKFWGTTFFILPVFGFLIQIFYPTIFGWMIQTWINSVYLFNYLSTETESYILNYTCKWGIDESVMAIQINYLIVVIYTLFVLFMIPRKKV